MKKIDELCINTIRTLSMDAIQRANSGHPGAPMGLAPAAYILWTNVLKHNPVNPNWFDRDRFVLSVGHASMLLYSLFFLTGYDLDIDDLKNFRQWGSKTPGHPEYGRTPGVETTTGPLGQGIANGVGMAMAERHFAIHFNVGEHKIIDHYTYVICGDGDMMEGITSEAASIAGHLGLGRFICIYDANNISIEGSIDITFTEDVAKRFEAYGWHTVEVKDGNNDLDAIKVALNDAKNETQKPSLIILRTHIAYGSPNKQGTADAHGAPLGEDEVRKTKENLGWSFDEAFYVPDSVIKHCRQCIEKGEKAEATWRGAYDLFKKKKPELAAKLTSTINGKLPEAWDADIPHFSTSDEPMATRVTSGKVLNAIAKNVHTLVGGSSDLAPSNKTFLYGEKEFQKSSYEGRNIRFGIREHAMGGIMVGLSLHGIRSYGGTFLIFADYMRPSIRLAALMKLPLIYIFTHDSIAVGEDGPTHHPVEHIASLRSIPGLIVIRPADATETVEAWRLAMEISDEPVAFILSRQKLPIIDRNIYASEKGLLQGAYILADSDKKPDVILIGTGAEVHVALKAKNMLEENGIAARVVSMPSWELFEKTSSKYKEMVLPSDIDVKISIEAGIPMGWERYIGDSGITVSMTGFGVSAPGNTLLKKFGFTAENIISQISV